jgi:hypothetical protein
VTQVPRELWPIVCRLAAACEWPPRTDADVAAFFDFANRQNLLPLLMADEGLPPEIAVAKPRFRALHALYRRRYELSRSATLELLRVLGSDAFLFYKGSDYRHRLYARPEQRPMTDVDVYVPAAGIAAALQRLAEAGYPRKYVAYGAHFAPGFYDLSFEIERVHIEVHRCFAQRVRAGIEYDGIWQRREWFEHDGIGGYRLSSADAVLAHAFGLAKDEFSSELNRYVDFYLLLQRYEGELHECVVRAKTWRIERPLFSALHLLSNLFPSARSGAVDEAMDMLLDPGTRKFLVDRVLPDPATERSGHITGRRVQLWRKYWLIDRVWRRFALAACHVCETVIGLAMEWRLRRNGLALPPRPTSGSR